MYGHYVWPNRCLTRVLTKLNCMVCRFKFDNKVSYTSIIGCAHRIL